MQTQTSQRRPIHGTFAAALLAMVLFAALPASAQTTASSSAFGESVNLQVVPLLGGGIPIQSPAQPFVSGSAPPAYNKTQSAASASLSLPLFGQVLTAHQLAAHAASTVPAADGATADATVADINLKLLGLLPLLTLSADQISSSAELSGSCASGLTSTGSATLSDVVLDGSLIPAIPVVVSPPPNTVLVNLGGIKVVVNEQIVSTSGNTKTLTVNAVHISASGALTALGLLSGDVILAQSKAQVRCPKADLAITKEATDSTVDQGDSFSYELTVTNGGPDAAQQVTVSDALPSQVSFGSATSSQGSCSDSGSTVTCDLGNLASGASATVTIFVKAKDAGTVVNTASVTSTTPDPNVTNNQASATVEVRAIADLSIEKIASETTVDVGETFSYVLLVENAGPGTASQIRVVDELPSQVSLISTSPTQGSCSTGSPGTTLICDIGDLAAGGSAKVTIMVTANAAGTFANTASVKNLTFDPSLSNNTSSVSVTAQSTAAADLSVSISVPSELVVEHTTIPVTATFVNNGPNTVASVELRVDSAGGPGVYPDVPGCIPSFRAVTCTIVGPFATGQGATRVFQFEVDEAAGNITLGTSVTGDLPDPNPANNSASIRLSVIDPPADLEATISAPPSVEVGDEFDVTFGVVNHGPNTTEPTLLLFITGAEVVSTPCFTSNPEQCFVGPLASGESHSETITLRATEAGTVELSNRVSGFGFGTSDLNSANNEANASVAVTPTVIIIR